MINRPNLSHYMKHFSLLILIANLFISEIYAQNWECVKTDGEYFYGFEYASENIIHETIRIDSTYDVSGFTYFVNHKTLGPGYCLGYSFLGRKVFTDNNGYYHFINTEHDTLYIKLNAEQNVSWIFYANLEKNLKIWAFVDTIVFDSFSGVTDSVKLIRFSAQDITGVSLNHSINSQILKLSKHYGFRKVFGFDQCPANFYSYTLVGIDPKKKGYLNFGDREIWDINTGDEFHKRKTTGYSSPYGHSKIETDYIIKVIDKWGSYDTVLYLKYLVLSRGTEERVSYYESYHFDTLYAPYIYTQVIWFNDPERQIWNTVPGEANFFKEFAMEYKIRTSVDSLYQQKYFEGPQLKKVSDSCYEEIYGDLVGSNYCIKGAGDNYYSLGTPFAGNSYQYANNYLLYYKKGDRTWGTPIVFTNGKEDNMDLAISVYPNPAENVIVFSFNSLPISDIIIQIYNSEGTRLMDIPVSGYEATLNVENLRPGIYFYRVNDSYVKGTGKIIRK